MKVFKFIFGIILLVFLVSCSPTTKELDVVEISPNNDLIAQFAFEGRIYSIEGNKTPAKKIKKEIGEIEKIVEDIKEDGQGKLFNSQLELLVRTKILGIKDVDKNVMVAVKINNKYYTAIVAGELE